MVLKQISLQQANSKETRPLIIEYEQEHEQEVLRIEEIINKNQYIFSDLFKDLNKISYLNFNDDKTLYISSLEDFKEYVSKRLDEEIDELIKPLLEEDETFAKVIFLRTILMGIYNELGLKVELPSDESEFTQQVNAVYVVLAAKYYSDQGQPEQLLEFIMEPNSDRKQDILLWLNEMHRFDLLNTLYSDTHRPVLQFFSKP